MKEIYIWEEREYFKTAAGFMQRSRGCALMAGDESVYIACGNASTVRDRDICP